MSTSRYACGNVQVAGTVTSVSLGFEAVSLSAVAAHVDCTAAETSAMSARATLRGGGDGVLQAGDEPHGAFETVATNSVSGSVSPICPL